MYKVIDCPFDVGRFAPALRAAGVEILQHAEFAGFPA